MGLGNPNENDPAKATAVHIVEFPVIGRYDRNAPAVSQGNREAIHQSNRFSSRTNRMLASGNFSPKRWINIALFPNPHRSQVTHQRVDSHFIVGAVRDMPDFTPIDSVHAASVCCLRQDVGGYLPAYFSIDVSENRAGIENMGNCGSRRHRFSSSASVCFSAMYSSEGISLYLPGSK